MFFSFRSGDLDVQDIYGETWEDAFLKALEKEKPKSLGEIVEIHTGETQYAAVKFALQKHEKWREQCHSK